MFYVASFAEFDDEEILKNILIWSHYANCHRGFCIRYKINDDSPLYAHFYNVNYFIDFPQLNDEELRVLINETPELYQEMIKKRLTTKAKQWDYEKEIRLIIPRDFPELEVMERGGKLLFDCVDGIYLGLEMSEENGKSLLEFAKEKDILSEVYCMYRHESKFELCSHHYQRDLRYRNFI